MKRLLTRSLGKYFFESPCPARALLGFGVESIFPVQNFRNLTRISVFSNDASFHEQKTKHGNKTEQCGNGKQWIPYDKRRCSCGIKEETTNLWVVTAPLLARNYVNIFSLQQILLGNSTRSILTVDSEIDSLVKFMTGNVLNVSKYSQNGHVSIIITYPLCKLM